MTPTTEDLHHLRAAQGWLGLSNSTEAERELDRLSPEAQKQAAVWSLRYSARSRAGNWTEALEAAHQECRCYPSAGSYVRQARALEQLGRIVEAVLLLDPLALHKARHGLPSEKARCKRFSETITRELVRLNMRLSSGLLAPSRTEPAAAK